MGPVLVTGRRVLIVDDHDGFRATARRLLQAEGWQVVGEAADGATAMAESVRLRPDVVLLDIGLPDIDGFTVAERLAGHTGDGGDGVGADHDGPLPMIVLVSSRDRNAYATKIDASPAVGFIGKHEIDGPRLASVLRGPAT